MGRTQAQRVRLTYEHPYRPVYGVLRRRPRGVETAYLCYSPGSHNPVSGLMCLMETVFDCEVHVALLRAYGTEDSVVDLQSGMRAFADKGAEAYAIFPSATRETVTSAIAESDQEEEECIRRLFQDGLVAFLHDGHDSLEFHGSPEEVLRSLRSIVGGISA